MLPIAPIRAWINPWAGIRLPGGLTMRRILFLALLLPGLAPAEVLDYDYVYLSRNGTESDGNGTAGGFKSFGEHTHLFASVDDTAFYAGSHADWDYDLKTWRVGAGGHYRLGPNTMIAPALSVFHSEGEVLAPSWTAPRRLNGNGYIAEVDLRHALNPRVELVAAARRRLGDFPASLLRPDRAHRRAHFRREARHFRHTGAAPRPRIRAAR